METKIIINGRKGELQGMHSRDGFVPVIKVKFESLDWVDSNGLAQHDRKSVHYYVIRGNTVEIADDWKEW